MRPLYWVCAILIGLASAPGCTLPEHPYDYCGPVWKSGSNENCRPNYRAGSILNGGGAASTASVGEAPIVPAKQLPLPGDHVQSRDRAAKLPREHADIMLPAPPSKIVLPEDSADDTLTQTSSRAE